MDQAGSKDIVQSHSGSHWGPAERRDPIEENITRESSTIQMRTARFRKDFPALGWVGKGGKFEKDKWRLKRKLAAAGVDLSMNTTLGVLGSYWTPPREKLVAEYWFRKPSHRPAVLKIIRKYYSFYLFRCRRVCSVNAQSISTVLYLHRRLVLAGLNYHTRSQDVRSQLTNPSCPPLAP
jgi:hypothetical protein